ncbi:MAG TPA: XRE family transcriptional regulator [Bryobacteraceae bacterium]|nr:XRE family transcriptional regulator [Bryobacteraceae bacterium]
MARNFKEPQARMDAASRAENEQGVRDELKRMALDELRSAKKLTQADLAEMLDVPQSSISRIEQRADMYLSTLRNYIHAMGGVLQIQAIFPDGGAVVINRFGDYEDRMYVVKAKAENGGVYRLLAYPFQHEGSVLSTRAFKASGFVKTMKALNLAEPQVSGIRKTLENGGEVEIGGRVAQRIFDVPQLVAAGFEAAAAEC